MRRPSCLYWGLTFAIVFPWSSIGQSWPMSVVGMLSSRCRLPRPGTFRRNLTSLESTLQCIFPPVPRVDLPFFSLRCYLGLTLPGPWAELLAFRPSSTSSSMSIISLCSAQKDVLQKGRCESLPSHLLHMFTLKLLCGITPSPHHPYFFLLVSNHSSSLLSHLGLSFKKLPSRTFKFQLS